MVTEIERFVMRIQWLSHSGFLVEGRSASLVFDRFQDPAGVLDAFFARRRALAAPPPALFLVSHAHADHCSPAILDWAREPGVAYVLEKDAARALLGGPEGAESAGARARAAREAAAHEVVRVRPGERHALGAVSVETFGSTDEGVSFLVRLDGTTVFHAGDLNDWYWEEESTAEELAADEAAFDRVVADVRAATGSDVPLGAALLPLDPRLGAHAMRGPTRFLVAVPARIFVPMHLPAGTGLPGAFAREAGVSARTLVLDGPGACAELGPDPDPGP